MTTPPTGRRYANWSEFTTRRPTPDSQGSRITLPSMTRKDLLTLEARLLSDLRDATTNLIFIRALLAEMPHPPTHVGDIWSDPQLEAIQRRAANRTRPATRGQAHTAPTRPARRRPPGERQAEILSALPGTAAQIAQRINRAPTYVAPLLSVMASAGQIHADRGTRPITYRRVEAA